MGPVRTGTAARFAGRHTRALALIAAVALVTLSLGAGVTSANSGRPHVDAENTFTKWITGSPGLPGDVLDMAGVVGGDVGAGTFAGTVLSVTGTGDVLVLNAIYGFTGSQHTFTALMHIVQTGSQAVLIGAVTDGWLQGQLVKGEYTVVTCTHGAVVDGTCFQGTLDIIQAFKP